MLSRLTLLPAACAAATLLASAGTMASSHREAPFITGMPKVDGTDFYMFNSYESGREGYVTLIANYLPLQDSYGGPMRSTLITMATRKKTSPSVSSSIPNVVTWPSM